MKNYLTFIAFDSREWLFIYNLKFTTRSLLTNVPLARAITLLETVGDVYLFVL